MKSEPDEVEVFINESVKLVETAEHKTYIDDTRLNGAEILDLGVVMTDEESSDNFEEEPQKTTPPSAEMTSPCRRKERSPSVEIIDLDTYEPKDKTVTYKTVVTKETKTINEFNKSKDNSDDEIEVFDVLNRCNENASKGRKKRLSYEEENIQEIQQRKENKPFDIKKNQGFIGMKVIRSSAISKQISDKSNVKQKNISKERKRKKRRIRDPQEKRFQSLTVASKLLSQIKKQETLIQNEPKVDNVNTKKTKQYSVSKLIDIQKNLIQDLGKLDYKLDINKNILKPSKTVKYVCDNKTPSTNAATFKDHQSVSQKKMLTRNSVFESKESAKTTPQNNKNVTDIQKKSDSHKPKKVISVEESKKEQRNIEAQNTKQELPKPKKMICLEEYKKAKENIDTKKNNTVKHKEHTIEINKPTTCQTDFLEVTSELKNVNIDKIKNVAEHMKEKGNIDTTMNDTVQRKDKSKEVNKQIPNKNDSMRIFSVHQDKRIDERVNVENRKKEKAKIDLTKKDTVHRKEESKEINKSTSMQNTSMRVTSELRKNKDDNKINEKERKNEKESVDTTKTATVQSTEESKVNTSSTSQNNTSRKTSELQRKDPKDRLKLLKPDYRTITNTKYKNKSISISPNRNNYTEAIIERVRKLQEKWNKEFKNVGKKNSIDKSVQSHAVSLAHEAYSQKNSEANPTNKSVQSEAVEVPNVSINVNYTTDNKITIEIINTSPKVPKLLTSDQQVQKQHLVDPLPAKITPDHQVSKVLIAKPVAPKPPVSDLRMPDPQIYPPVSMPLLIDPVSSDLDPSVPKRPASDQQVPNATVSKPTTPSAQLRALRLPSKPLPSEPLVPVKIVPRSYNFQESKRQMNHLHASNFKITNQQGFEALPDQLVVSNTFVSKTSKPDSRKSKQQVVKMPSPLDPLMLSQQLSKPLAPKSQVYNPRESNPLSPKSQVYNPRGLNPLSPKSQASYPPVSVPVSWMPPLAPNPSVPNLPVQKPPLPKPLDPDPSLKLTPKSKSTQQPVETREMIEKAVLEYKLGEYYAHQQQIQMNAKDAAYVNSSTDYTKTVRLASMPHQHQTDFKNKNLKTPLKILSVEDIGDLYMHRQSEIMHSEQLASIALQNISKLVQNVPPMPKQFPIQRLVTDRKNTGHKTAMPSNYYNPATLAARMYAQQVANPPGGTNDPRLRNESYAPYVPYCQNMPCMPPESRLNFPTQQNVSMYQQPNSYLSYNHQYYPSEMHNYIQSFCYNVPNQTDYNPSMGVPVCEPPPPPYPVQQPIPKTVPSKENESIIGKNNDGVIKKINITSPYRPVWCKNIQPNEPLRQEVKENKTNVEKYEDKAREKNIAITPVSTKSEMQKVLDNFISDNTISDNDILENSIEVEKEDKSVTNLKRSHESTISNEEKTQSRPCPLSKKIKPSDPITAPEQSGDQIQKNTGYSPPILPIPPNYANYFSTSKPVETKSGSGERKAPTPSPEELANLLQLNKKDFGKVLEKSGYKTRRIN